MKNKVNTVQCTGTRKQVLLSPNFTEKEPAVVIRDSLGSAPREPSWPGIATVCMVGGNVCTVLHDFSGLRARYLSRILLIY